MTKSSEVVNIGRRQAHCGSRYWKAKVKRPHLVRIMLAEPQSNTRHRTARHMELRTCVHGLASLRLRTKHQQWIPSPPTAPKSNHLPQGPPPSTTGRFTLQVLTVHNGDKLQYGFQREQTLSTPQHILPPSTKPRKGMRDLTNTRSKGEGGGILLLSH